uniref:Uncharacterized protein n=1 Tax=viral metagenome TaxID=1070528 RepID=A0A6M3K1W8_9ZZZZ
MADCNHRWRKIYEEGLVGPPFPSGFECIDCDEYVAMSDLTPAGIGGTVLEKACRLVGPHGGCGNCSDGTTYKEQIVDEQGNLIIIRPE